MIKWIVALLAGLSPVLFSHLPYVFGIPFSWTRFGVYEGPRLVLLGLVLILLVFLQIQKSSNPMTPRLRKFLMGFFLMMTSLSIIQMLNGHNFFILFFGLPPYQTGYAELMLAVGWIIVSSRLSDRELVFALRGALTWGILVLIYAIAQLFGHDPISYNLPFEAGRIFSTLGNANTLAIYLMLWLPVAFFSLRKTLRIATVMGILILIFATGSWSILILSILFVTAAICYLASAPLLWYLVCLAILGITGAQIYFSGFASAKILSGFTRLQLLREAIQMFIEHPLGIITGFAPDQIYDFLNTKRSVALLRYVDPNFIVAHFHNTPVELVMRFGSLALASMYVAYRAIRRNLTQWSESTAFPTLVGLLFLFGTASLFHYLESPIWILAILLYFAISRNLIRKIF